MFTKRILLVIPFLCLFLFSATIVICQTSKDFVPFLIDIPGWKGEEPEAIDITYEGMKGINVNREYYQDEKSLTVGIMVGQQAMGLWNPGYYEGFKVEAEDTLIEVKKINGFLVIHTYDKAEKAGMVVVLLQDVSPGEIAKAVFVLSFYGMEDSEGVKLSQKFDWAKISNKAKSL